MAEKSVSSDGAMASVLMKLSLTPDQLGADIAFLSCFPGECEYLYGPGTYMEPKPERGGARMPGAVKVVEGSIHLKEHPVFIKGGGTEGGGGEGGAEAKAEAKAAEKAK